MRWAYTAEQIRAAEQPLLTVGEPLMRRAAWGLAQQILDLLRARDVRGAGQTSRAAGISGARVSALVGKGNNGGDALWALSFLGRRGVHVTAIPIGVGAEDLHPAGRNALLRAGGSVEPTLSERTDVVVDAIFGTGFRGTADTPAMLRSAGVVLPERAAVVACDVPSGLDASTGEVRGAVLSAELTVTFGALKIGLFLGDGPEVCGRVECIDLGLDPVLAKIPTNRKVSVLPKNGISAVTGIFAPPAWNAHKYSRGVVALSAGSAQYPGAAVLAVAAAVATGVGMVRFIGDDEVARAVVAAHPEVVAGPEPEGRADAWVLGPGWGDGPEVEQRYRRVLELATELGAPVVLDASALELITDADIPRFAALRRAGGDIVLTPHAGEMARLEHRLLPEVPKATDALDRTRRLAAHLGAHVLLKGPTTVIADPQGRSRFVTTGGPELATAGSGDTLAGLIGSALARAVPAADADGGSIDAPDTLDRVAAAAALHGLAGRTAALAGPFGASSLAPAVRTVLAESGRITAI